MIFNKEKSSAISFPLGGIGSGSISLAGNGRLIDWEIFNRPNKGSYNGISHFAVRAEENGEVKDIRILNGDLPPHYIGNYQQTVSYCGYGYGPEIGTLVNLPHFRKHTFEGTFPTARINFGGEKFPAEVALEAWSVFIPGESLPSSLPAGFFEITLKNDTDRTIDYTVIGVLSNPWSRDEKGSYNKVENNQLTLVSGENHGDLSLTLCEDAQNCSYQTYLYRGLWRDYQEIYFRDLQKGGFLQDRRYEPSSETTGTDHGAMAAHFRLKPNEQKCVRFIISWSVPYRHIENLKDRKALAEKFNLPWEWKNYYATIWQNSAESGAYARENYCKLRSKTYQFRDALFATELPELILDGIADNLAVLKSPVCMRLEDGTFYTYEGVGSIWGSCEGSCTHVLNYAQSLPFLFPDLERSMRESHLKYSVDELGGSHFRLYLPYGIKADLNNFRPCADGQFGDIMKIYRDWKIGGDEEYLRKYYPTIKKTMEYAWNDKNPDCWDIDETGVLHGRQHHTLDMELFGPNAFLTGHYLGGLNAMSKIADFMGDKEFAEKCRKLFEKGKKWVNKNLFNGEYFYHKIDLHDRSIIDKFAKTDNYWSEEHQEIKYQIADGCEIDSCLAQNYANLYGLDKIFDDGKCRKHLLAVYKNNFYKTMRNFANFWRVYSLDDEAGVIICSYPADKPAIPLTYNSETMTGFEWAYATHLLSMGMTKKSFEVATAIRKRFDGKKRNPFNEFECGSNYTRSMASMGCCLPHRISNTTVTMESSDFLR
ncbi:MAG: hypothetical protein IKD09_01150 [Lentisphaeria bacterium]|nr:hypothetical protein [Lentisphaeria bacterium]